MNLERDRKAWGCTRCGKKDRKGRVIDHILKDHVPADRVPYRCTLCKFRCQDPDTLQKHITAYSRHVEAEQRGGKPNYHLVLKKSANPMFITEDDLFPLQSGEPRIIEDSGLLDEEDPFPDWLTGPKVKTPEYVPTSKALLNNTEMLNDFSVGSLVDWMQPQNQVIHNQDPFLAQRISRHEDVLNTPKSKSQYLLPRENVSTPQSVDVINILPTMEDQQDPLFSGMDVTTPAPPVLPLPPGLSGTAVASQTTEPERVEAGTQTTIEDRMATVLEEWSRRFVSALDETVKASSSSARALQDIKEDLRRVERRVSAMTRIMEDTSREKENDQRVRSVVIKRPGPPTDFNRKNKEQRKDS